jgi:hypothetical protein
MIRRPDTAEELTEVARRFFTSHAGEFGLDGTRVDVRYVLNWGGFVNTSLQVRDGRSGLHVKLSTTDGGQAALRRWQELDSLLRPYHAPPILGWVDVGAAGGLVFPLLKGSAPSPSPEVIESVLAQVQNLWVDAELAKQLRGETAETAADCYLGTYHDRFCADLAAVDCQRPPFLPEGDLSYMREEVAYLESLVREGSPFLEEVTAPTHGDLWLNNVLWQNTDSWWLLDWDDLQVGDPAMDLVTLTGPTSTDLRPLKYLDQTVGELSGAARERLNLLGRASLLDWVIDPLADWIEAKASPAHESAVRAEKERVHREALSLYRELYRR